jgi:hypothetical protein
MAGMMSMLVSRVALQTEVVVIAVTTCHKQFLRKNLDTGVAGPSWLFWLEVDRFAVLSEGTRHLLLNLRFGLWTNPLGGAVYNSTVRDKTLYHPVA